MSQINKQDSLVPFIGKLVHVRDVAPEIKMFGIALQKEGKKSFKNYHPGQFAFISAFGAGEAPFGLASTPARGATLEFAIQRMGEVTTALHEMSEGDMVGIRGPLGNSFPLGEFEGKDIIVIGGGVGSAPLRPVIHTIIDNPDKYGKLSILMAARHPSLHLFKDEYPSFEENPKINLYQIVDQADENWPHHEGLVTDLIKEVDPSPTNAIAIICGPPIMIFYVNKLLDELGFLPEQQYTTLEARMHCGIGKCGRCNIDKTLICLDGPVFSMKEVASFSESYL